ncbi:unannotated protein [freshwater metagenome]|jgi:O-antigen/teichoic acid export membrane protein|uniref:Unannotated protein n=1 Tax=freshwater metagenome TaxID=449393 RepID=A0A6J7GJL7_9ZZZZ|nr:hypothetical protein [Actinomycetota bacterium]MSV41761.1 hypothetical protein [Actinomycetota bacterium]MSV95481.1 hypothetical protein [Actinomycetota bacterium]MSW61143.1 hypothetical protein [Actinomycetota bacterium]GDX30989.1 hypothetical protein LBMAG14_14650 [Actinomycetes bacterium]
MAQRTQRLLATARHSVPEGTYAVGAGLLVAGLTAYGFQIISFRALSKPDYAALNALWVFVFVLAPGFFLPLEQEVGRAVSHRQAQDIGGGPVVKRAALAGVALSCGLALITILAALGTPLVETLFEGDAGLAACLIIALFTYCFEHIARGTLSGNHRFGPYGLIIGAEGAVRIVGCIALALAGVSNPVYYGLCLAIPPAIATGIALWGQSGLVKPGPVAPWSEISTNIGYLLMGSLLAQVLSYSPFIGAQLLAGPNDRGKVADLIVGLFLARIPILLFQAVQASLLPRLAALASEGNSADFRDGLKKLIVVVVGIAVIGVIAAATLGAAVGQILFGDKFVLGSRDLALLAAGCGLFIIALTLAQALIALMGHAQAVIAWAAGIVMVIIVTALTGPDLYLRVELGFIAGAATSTALMGLFLGLRLRRELPAGSLASLVEQIEHEPLEI